MRPIPKSVFSSPSNVSYRYRTTLNSVTEFSLQSVKLQLAFFLGSALILHRASAIRAVKRDPLWGPDAFHSSKNRHQQLGDRLHGESSLFDCELHGQTLDETFAAEAPQGSRHRGLRLGSELGGGIWQSFQVRSHWSYDRLSDKVERLSNLQPSISLNGVDTQITGDTRSYLGNFYNTPILVLMLILKQA